MAEQDTSKWELNKTNRFYTNSRGQQSIRIDANEIDGVWLEIHAEDNSSQHWHKWIPPEIAEAMGTMLLYAAQEWRLKHGDTDPR